MRIAVGLMLPCIVAACTALDNGPQPGVRKVYEGLYRSGFEMSSFLPEGVPEIWWISGDVPSVPGSELEAASGPGGAYVIWISVEGAVTEYGRWGHLGRWERELTVLRVLEAKPASSDEFELAKCDLPAPEWATSGDIMALKAYCDLFREFSK